MKEFIAVFQLSKTIIFEVHYFTLSTNKTAYFSTTAAEFCRNKKDFVRCGQAQNELTKKFLICRAFWKKWDPLHLRELTPEQYNELQADLNKLKTCYNYICVELDETKKPYSPNFAFSQLAEWTKQNPKR